MTVELQRNRPPTVYLMGTAINVRVEAQDPGASGLTQPFETLLGNEMCRNDPRLKIDNAKPDTLIDAAITTLRADEHWERRRSTEYKKVGTKQVWNEKKRQYETKDDYQNVPVTKPYKIVEGLITASLRVTETATGNVLHSETVRQEYKKEFLDGVGAPIEGRLPTLLVEAAVHRMLPAVVPTIETIEVQLAKGKLEDSSKLAKSGLWTRMMETLQTMPPLKKPQDDAYRLYNLGVAAEALSYQAEDDAVGRKMLEQAAMYYGKAIDQKPDEKYFRGPQIRIQTAMAQAGKTEGQKAMYARSLAAKSKSLTNKPSDTLTNQNVIDLVGSGLDEGILLDMIRQAKSVNFDLGAQGVVQLLQNKVSNRAIAAMRARAGNQ